MYLGGACGASFVTGNAIGVPALGAASYGAIFIASQLVVAFIFDVVGAFGLDAVPATARRGVGIALALCGAVLHQTRSPLRRLETWSFSAAPPGQGAIDSQPLPSATDTAVHSFETSSC